MNRRDAALRSLPEAGLSKDLTYHGYHTLQGHVLGFMLQLNFPFDAEELQELAATFVRNLPADEYPYLVEHITRHIEPGEEQQGAFEFGLDLILDGLERLRDAA